MPQQRYWANYPGSTDTGLAAAVFLEILPTQTPDACTWEGVPDQPSIFTGVRLVHPGFGNNSGSPSNWTVRVTTAAIVQAENTLSLFGNDSCQAPKVLPEIFNISPLDVGRCDLFPIAWYEDADDVRP